MPMVPCLCIITLLSLALQDIVHLLSNYQEHLILLYILMHIPGKILSEDKNVAQYINAIQQPRKTLGPVMVF